MKSLYGRLFTYRESTDRRPVEDFLTEALSDLLNRIPRKESTEFVESLMLPDCDAARAAWIRYLSGPGSAANLVWRTQELTSDRKRVDLLLEGDGRKLLVVESKISSALRKHGVACSSDADGDATAQPVSLMRDQLATYGKWLAAEEGADDGWEGALTLLTHACLPPAGFGGGDKQT